MLYKLNPTSDNDPIGYQLGPKTSAGDVRTLDPVVIRGDTDTFLKGYALIHFKNKDPRLVQPYDGEDNPSVAELLRSTAFSTAIAFAGLKPGEYVATAVLHRQQWGGFVRPDIHNDWLNLHLPTGLSFNPYFHGSDFVRMDLAKQIINLVRGYNEPSAPENSRIFGATAEGTEAHKLQTTIIKILAGSPIEDLERFAPELEREGYILQRRQDGRLRGKKSVTATTQNGTDVTLFWGQEKRKSWLLKNWRENSLEQLLRLLARLNRMCLKKAKARWFKYSTRLGMESEIEAERGGFGFNPFTIHDVLTKENYETHRRRDRILNLRKPATITLGKSSSTVSTVRIEENGFRAEKPFTDLGGSLAEANSRERPFRDRKECRDPEF